MPKQPGKSVRVSRGQHRIPVADLDFINHRKQNNGVTKLQSVKDGLALLRAAGDMSVKHAVAILEKHAHAN